MWSKCITAMLLLVTLNSHADTIGKYIGIAKSIPQARLKADPRAQAWAHSARTVLTVTDETIAQTIIAMQGLAKKHKLSLFCLPQGKSINTALINQLLTGIAAAPNIIDPNKTISEVVVEQLSQDYPCDKKQNIQPKLSLFGDKSYQMQSVRR